MAVLATIVVLGVLIFVHELGHFIAARSVGIPVERFSIGFGPRILGFTRGDTEYVISVIPLGGYVKMGGMDDEIIEVIEGGEARAAEGQVESMPEGVLPADTISEHGPGEGRTAAVGSGGKNPDGFDAKSVWARAWVVSAGVIMNFLFAFLAYTIVAAGWGFPELQTTRIGVLDPGSVPTEAQALLDVPAGASIQRIGAEEVTHWGEVRRAILDAPDGPTAIVFVDPPGEVQIDLTGADLREEVFAAMDFWLDPVLDVIPGTPADDAGVQRGDRVVAVDVLEIATWPQLVSAVRVKPEIPLQLAVERDGERVVISITPAAEEEADPETGEMTTIGRIGVSPFLPEIAFSSMPPLQAVGVGWSDTVYMTQQILGFLKDLVTGQMSARNLGGIVSIGEMSGQAAADGFPFFLRFMALFSVNLAVLNLLPIPILDGGHLLFLGIEAVRGQPLSIKQRMRWSQVGFVVLMGIMALALGNDLLRLFGR